MRRLPTRGADRTRRKPIGRRCAGGGRRRGLGAKALLLAALPLALLVAACGTSGDEGGGGSGGGVDEITSGWVWYGPIQDTGWNVANDAGKDAMQERSATP